MNEVEKLLSQRAKLLSDAGALLKENPGASWTAEHEANFDKMHADAAKLKEQADALSNAKAREARQREAEASLNEGRGRQAPVAGLDNGGQVTQTPITYMGKPLRLPRGSAIAARSQSAEYNAAFMEYFSGGAPSAALQTDIADLGGYLAPAQFVADYITELNNTFWMRRLCRVLPPTTSQSITMPRRKSRANPFVWGTELSTPTPDTGLKFGQYSLSPHYMTGEFEISKDLMSAASINPETIVRSEIVFASGEIEEKAFMYGDGNKKPFGLMVPSNDGIPASRDVSGDLAVYDTWVDAKMSFREPYLNDSSLAWLANRQTVKGWMKLKATTGEPLWLPSVREGQPDRFLSINVQMSEYLNDGTGVAGAYASGDYAALLGNFRYYDILDGLDMGVMRHTDSYYDRRNLVGYVIRRKVDAQVRIAEAFTRVKKS